MPQPTHPYIPTWAGFLYLAVVLDAWSRRVVGWTMATHLRTELVLEAVNMALTQRRPSDVIHHSDSAASIRRSPSGSAVARWACRLGVEVTRSALRHAPGGVAKRWRLARAVRRAAPRRRKTRPRSSPRRTLIESAKPSTEPGAVQHPCLAPGEDLRSQRRMPGRSRGRVTAACGRGCDGEAPTRPTATPGSCAAAPAGSGTPVRAPASIAGRMAT